MSGKNLKDMGYKVESSIIEDVKKYKKEEEGIINHFYIQKDYIELSQNDTHFKGGMETVQLTIEEVRAILKAMEEYHEERN